MSVAPQAEANGLPSPYLSVEAVAALLGRSSGHVRRLCQQWKETGLAKLFGSTWGIHPRAHKALHTDAQRRRQDLESEAEIAGEGYTRKEIALAKARRDIVVGYESFDSRIQQEHERREAYIKHLVAIRSLDTVPVNKLSLGTLYRWERAYKKDGLRGLLRKRTEPKGDGVNGHAALDYLFNIINAGNRTTLTHAIEETIGHAKRYHPNDPAWQLGSYSSIRQEINRRRPKILKVLTDKGPHAALATCVPKGRRDFESVASNEAWVGDERTLDVWCRVQTARGWVPVRPKVTAWLDMRSRKLTGWVLAPHADSNTILGSLKLGIMKHGKPKRLVVDWGKDYKKATGSPHSRRWKTRGFDGARIGSVLDELNIEACPVLPYTPWSKSIESFFKTMKNDLDKMFLGFWGGTPLERHEDRHKYIKANLEKLPTLDDLSRAIAGWLDIYHRKPHTSVDMFGKSPIEAMEAFRDGPAQYESAAVLEHLFQEFVGPRTVRRDGIRVGGFWYGHGDPRIVTMQGERVLLAMQPDDVGYAMVCDLARTPKFRVECEQLRGFTKRDAADLGKLRARILRPHKKTKSESRRQFAKKPVAEMLADRAAGVEALHGKRDDVEDTPPSLVIRPALEEALKDARPTPTEARARAVRTGTDDADVNVSIEDMLYGIDEVHGAGSSDEDEPIDFFGLGDPDV